MDSGPSPDTVDAEPDDGGGSTRVSRQARRAFRARDFRKAAPLLEAAAAEDPNNVSVLTKLARALGQLDRKSEADAIHRRILELEPTNTRIRTRLGEAEWDEGRRDEALAHFKAAAVDENDTKSNLRLGQRLISQWQINEAERAFERVVALEPKNVPGLLGLARCAGYAGDREKCLTFLRRAAAIQPENPQIALYIRRQEQEPAQLDWKQELSDAAVALRDEGRPTGERLWAAQRLISYGVTDIILETLPRFEAKSSQARRFVQIARQLDRSGLSQPSWASSESSDQEKEQLNAVNGVVERLKPGADVLLLVFSGAMNRAFLSLDILHRVLRTTGASIIYLRDLERTVYAGGVVGLGSDFNSTTQALRDLRKRSGARRLLTFGNCIGCAGALRYGLALGAEAMLGISPRIGAPAADALAPSTKTKLQALMDVAPEYAGDLVDLYRAAGPDAPRVSLVAGEGSEPEASFARDMAAKVPGVVYAAIPGVYLECFGDILARGLLPPLMASFVADGEISPDVLEGLRCPEPNPKGVAPGVRSPASEVSP